MDFLELFFSSWIKNNRLFEVELFLQLLLFSLLAACLLVFFVYLRNHSRQAFNLFFISIVAIFLAASSNHYIQKKVFASDTIQEEEISVLGAETARKAISSNSSRLFSSVLKNTAFYVSELVQTVFLLVKYLAVIFFIFGIVFFLVRKRKNPNEGTIDIIASYLSYLFTLKRPTRYFALGALLSLLLLKLSFFSIVFGTVILFITLAPMIIVAAMSVLAYWKRRQGLPYRHFLLIALKLEAVVFGFYFLYSPESFEPVFRTLWGFFAKCDAESFFLMLSYLGVLAIAFFSVFFFFRLYQKSQGNYPGSLRRLSQKMLYSLFFIFFLMFIGSAFAYPGAYRPLTDSLGDLIYTASYGKVAVFKGEDPLNYKQLKSLKDLGTNLSGSLKESAETLTASIAKTNKNLASDISETKTDLLVSISESVDSLESDLEEDIDNKLRLSGGTLTGDLTIKEDLVVDSNLEVNGIISGTFSGTFNPSGNLDMDGNIISNIGNSGTDFTASGGLNLADALTISSGGASITGNTSITGTVTAGTWNGTDIDIYNYSNLTATGALALSAGSVLTHVSGNGYNHVPSNGAAGQILLYSSAGTATWSTLTGDSITADSLDFTELDNSLSIDSNTTIDTSSNTLGVTGLVFGNNLATTTDDYYIGFGGSDGRIVFDNQTTDEINFMNANVGIGTDAPGEKLSLSGGNFLHSAGNPELITSLTYGDMVAPNGVYVSGKYAYIAFGTVGLRVADVSVPGTPVAISTYNTAGSALDVYVSGQYAYVADGTSGLQVVNISNSEVPALTGTYNTAGTATGVYVSGKYAYVADAASGLQIIDISNPASPTLAGTLATTNALDVYVSGQYAYVADGTSGLRVINISNPASPSLTGTHDTSGTATDVYISSPYAYVADGASGLQIIDISNPADSSAPVGNYSTDVTSYTSVNIAGNYAYLVDIHDLIVIDISSPTAPALAGGYDALSTNFYSAYVFGKYAYAVGAFWVGQLYIFDINGIEAPSLYAGNIQTNDMNVTENADIGNNLYVRNGINAGAGGIMSDGNISSAGQGYFVGTMNLGFDAAAGTANTAGALKLFSAGDNAFYTTFTAGTQTANATYTLPTAMPGTDGYALISSSAGVMSWSTGLAFANNYATTADDYYLGLGAADGRIVFDGTPATDEVNIMNANLGIGDDTPDYKFDVETDASASYVANFFNDGGNADRYGIQIQGGADDGVTGTTYYLTALDGDGGVVGYLQNDGGTFSVNDPSDIRTKTNIINTSLDGLDIVGNLRVVDFNRIQNPDGPVIHGFIAQEVDEIYPFAVSMGPDGMLGIAQEKFIPLIIKAVQELNIGNTQQELKIETLELKTNNNVSGLTELQSSIDEQLALISSRFAVHSSQIAENESRISVLEDGITNLDSQIVELQKKLGADPYAAKLELIAAENELNKTSIDFLLLYLGLDTTKENLGISISGTITSEGIAIQNKEESETIGTATILSGDSSVIIETKAVSEGSRIFVTLQGDNPTPLSVFDKKEGQSFSVKISEPQEEDLNFNWWIVEEK